MASQEGLFTNKGPLLDETKYAFWSVRMWTYLKDLGFDIFQLVVNGYTSPITPPKYLVGKNPSEHNAKSMNVILSGLSK
jgi:hypothetical protein